MQGGDRVLIGLAWGFLQVFSVGVSLWGINSK